MKTSILHFLGILLAATTALAQVPAPAPSDTTNQPPTKAPAAPPANFFRPPGQPGTNQPAVKGPRPALPALPSAQATNVTAATNPPVITRIPALPVNDTPAEESTQAAPDAPPGQPSAQPGPPTIPPDGQNPAAQGNPALAPGNPALATVNPDDEILPGFGIKFDNAPIDQVLTFYADLVGRTVLKSPQVTPATLITIKAQTQLTRREARQALDTVLALNNITMVPVGEKFVSAVPMTQALQEGAAFVTGTGDKLPEAAQFVTQIVTLTNALPSEVVSAIQPFAKIQGGIVPIDSSQMLVLRDYAVNVKRMLEVIKKVDVVIENDYKLEVFPVRYGKVEDIYNVMSGLVSGGGGVSSSGSRASRASTGARYNRVGTTSSSRRTGTMGTTQAGQGQTQQPSTTQSSFQQRLQQIVSRAAGGDTQLLADARIIPDERANSLVVYANKHDMTVLTNLVAKLDVALAQVLIEGIVMEVSLDNSSKFGVSALQRPQTSGKLTGAGIMDNGQGFLNPSSLATNVPSGAGLSYFGQWGNDLDVTVSAIASDNTINVMSKPRIQTTHAVPAEFFVGDTVPYITGTYYSDYNYSGNRSSYQQLEVGITLSVTPYITPDGLVVMEISQDISQLGTAVKIDNNDVPTTTSRRTSATVSVADGKTIMLGGYITSTKSKSKSGVPGLKDIPLLGNLFRSKSNSDKRVELIVLMRPTVLPSASDASLAAEVEKRKLPGVVAAEQEFNKEEQKRLNATEKKLKKGSK